MAGVARTVTAIPPDEAEPRPRTFNVKRLDRDRWWPVTLAAADVDLDRLLRDDGFDPATRRLVKDKPALNRAPRSPELHEDRWVRIMADVCADGVWNRQGASCLAENLPVSPPLLARLLAWQAWYDRDSDEEAGPFDRTAFAAEGLAIARAVKAQLPDWTVVYFDESGPTGQQPRATFEYEVEVPADVDPE